MPLVLEICAQNARANVQEPDFHVADTHVLWVPHQAALAKLTGLDIATGVVQLTWELLKWI